MDKKLIETLKGQLEEARSTIEKELLSFATKDELITDDWNAKHPGTKERGDQEEEADETQEYSTLLSLEHNLETKLKDVNVALQKIADNAYGQCEKCGKEIELERLQVCPEAKTCVSCNS